MRQSLPWLALSALTTLGSSHFLNSNNHARLHRNAHQLAQRDVTSITETRQSFVTSTITSTVPYTTVTGTTTKTKTRFEVDVIIYAVEYVTVFVTVTSSGTPITSTSSLQSTTAITTSTAKTSKTTKKQTSKKTTAQTTKSSTSSTSPTASSTTSLITSTISITLPTTSISASPNVTVASVSVGNTVAPPAPTDAGTVSGCSAWYVVQSGDYCYLVTQKFDISLSTFLAWNPAVGSNCAYLKLGYAYCVGTTSQSPSIATTAVTSAVAGITPAAVGGAGSGSGISGDSGNNPVSISSSSNTAGGLGQDVYRMYTGAGTAAAGWPQISSWASFDAIWSANLNTLQNGCMNAWSVPNNSPAEIAALKSAIIKYAGLSGLDQRFILAIVMQESLGCVRVHTTNWGVRNPGLMQSHDGSGTCNDVTVGGIANPCPASSIDQMISDGVMGTSSGDGLKQLYSNAVTFPVVTSSGGASAAYYIAARMYNGGANGYRAADLGTGCCTLCYSSDVANRLTGWALAPSTCNLSVAAA